jgi:adenine-specific DNA-methyltransferase
MPTLTWVGKDKVVNHHLDVPFRVLQRESHFDAPDGSPANSTDNRIIHGDNLAALKSLLPEFEGKINCIYIDPPYNTGNESWVYNDAVNDPKIKKWLGQVVGKEGEDLSRHDKWLCMMYPRLKLLQKLLHKNGSLVISIGHQELFTLMLVIKEIFGSKQIACVTVQTSGGKPSGSFNNQHEYLIFILPNDFEANPMNFTGGKERTPFEGLTLATFDKKQRPNQAYPIFINMKNNNIERIGDSLQERIRKGIYKGELDNFQYDFNEATEDTVAIWPITSKGKDCVWRLTPNRLLSDWEKGYIKISPNRNQSSLNKYSIQYLPEGIIKKIEKGILKVDGKEANAPTLTFGENKTVGSDIPTLWLEKEFYSVKGTTLLSEIFNSKLFDYPKPLSLITEILRGLTSEDNIVLDSFAGSGSTAHAVLNLNNEDGGNRRFILIEMEDYADTITAERVRRVMSGYGEGNKQTAGLGGSFDYYTVGAAIFNADDTLNEAVGIDVIRDYVSHSEVIPTEYRTTQDNAYTPYLLGLSSETAWLFYYKVDAVTCLDLNFLGSLKFGANKPETAIIYADKSLLDKEFMTKHNIIFKKIPRDITRF